MANDVQMTVVDRFGRKCAGSGAKWEPIIGYSRAVRAGNQIAVTGTVGINADGSYSPKVEDQTRRALLIIQTALESLGGSLQNVIRTRMYVTDISNWQRVAEVHGQLFADIRPATTLVEVSRLIDFEAMIEIEADAVVG